MMKKLYISGKITGLDLEVAKSNFKQRQDVLSKEYSVINPILYTPSGITNPTWHDYLRLDIKMLCDCDVIYMMKDWESSEGANFELAVALKLGLEVIYEEANSNTNYIVASNTKTDTN